MKVFQEQDGKQVEVKNATVFYDPNGVPQYVTIKGVNYDPSAFTIEGVHDAVIRKGDVMGIDEDGSQVKKPTFVEYTEDDVHYSADGDMIMASGLDFVNLQESRAGFGKTPEKALADYKKKEVGAYGDRVLADEEEVEETDTQGGVQYGEDQVSTEDGVDHSETEGTEDSVEDEAEDESEDDSSDEVEDEVVNDTVVEDKPTDNLVTEDKAPKDKKKKGLFGRTK